MSVHTMRQRTALQRAQQRWQHPHAEHLHLVQAPAVPSTRLERFNAFVAAVHDRCWLWILAALAVGVADLGITAVAMGWWHP